MELQLTQMELIFGIETDNPNFIQLSCVGELLNVPETMNRLNDLEQGVSVYFNVTEDSEEGPVAKMDCIDMLEDSTLLVTFEVFVPQSMFDRIIHLAMTYGERFTKITRISFPNFTDPEDWNEQTQDLEFNNMRITTELLSDHSGDDGES